MADMGVVDAVVVATQTLARGPGAAARQCDLLRDVFGPDPFRPVPVDPRWLTADVIGLARAIYEDREASLLPILADALEETGCGDAAILGHCRRPGEHVRGCWVVDQLTGRE
jgi:hypothetical protein